MFVEIYNTEFISAFQFILRAFNIDMLIIKQKDRKSNRYYLYYLLFWILFMQNIHES